MKGASHIRCILIFSSLIVTAESLFDDLLLASILKHHQRAKHTATISLLLSRALQPNSTPMVDLLKMQVFNFRVGTSYTK